MAEIGTEEPVAGDLAERTMTVRRELTRTTAYDICRFANGSCDCAKRAARGKGPFDLGKTCPQVLKLADDTVRAAMKAFGELF